MVLVTSELGTASIDFKKALVPVIFVDEVGPLLEGVEVGALLDGVGGNVASGINIVLELGNGLRKVLGESTGGGLTLVFLSDLVDD